MKKIMIFNALLLASFTLTSCDSTRANDPEMQGFVKKIKDNLVFVEGGSYMMGDAGAEHTDEDGNTYFGPWTGHKDNKPAHKVTLTSYSMQKYETTYVEYDYFCEVTGRDLLRKKHLKKKSRGPTMPVSRATWEDAKDYCQWLGEVTGEAFDLPTEAQWEYAARSRGQNVGYATDNGQIVRGENYRDRSRNANKRSPWHPEPPGTYPPNPLGLYEMSGNVWEWVNDWYSYKYYKESPEHNPQGPEKGYERILRGYGTATSYRLNTLYGRMHRNADWSGGIRCVVNATEPVQP